MYVAWNDLKFHYYATTRRDWHAYTGKIWTNLKMYVEVKRCLLQTSKKYEYEVSIERYE